MATPSAAMLDHLEYGKHLKNFLSNTDKTAKAKQTLDYLSNRLQILDNYWTTIKDNHGLVCRENQELQSTHEYFTAGQYYDLEDLYVAAKTELARRMAALAPPPDASTSTATPSIQFLPQPQALKPLDIPAFSGEQKDWDDWKEMFCSMVKDQASYTKSQKLARLLTSVQGKAAARLAGLTRTGSNFDTAWSILMMTYDNKRVRLSGYLTKLLSMPTAKECSSDLFRLLDVVEEAIRALTVLERPVEHWDDWFLHLVEIRLDPVTKKDWEKSIEGQDDFPPYATLKSFLEHRCRTLMTADSLEVDKPMRKSNDKQSSSAAPKKASPRSHSAHTAQVESKGTANSNDKTNKAKLPCSLCQGKHFISYCPQFVNADSDTRWNLVKRTSLCENCLRPNHNKADCSSGQRCRVENCNQPHHTFLHPAKKSTAAASSTSYHVHTTTKRVVLLATARIVLETAAGDTMLVRALLDPGSEVSFVSERVVQGLRLTKKRSCTRISGVGGDPTAKAVGEVDLAMKNLSGDKFKLHLTALVLPRLTVLLPTRPVLEGNWEHIHGIELADPKYFIPGGVDCLLGADVYHLLLLDGVRRGLADEPLAQNTVLGWVLTGPTSATAAESATATSAHIVQCLHITSASAAEPASDTSTAAEPASATSVHVVPCLHTTSSCCQLRNDLRRFWEQEEVPTASILSPAEQECNEHYSSTHSRDEQGRYVLRLPFSKMPNFPGSFGIAKSRLLSGERRYQRKPVERQAYSKFMQEYEQLGHMERVPHDDLDNPDHYYIPHHAVFKSDGSGKIRVVFNASQAAANGLSLNECLHAGEKLQTDITVILTRWRFFRFVFTSDIVKMFRQFKIHPDDTNWLRIVWRNNPEEAVQSWRLTTVTYGTACAPFQAIRTLNQLAQDENTRLPLGADVLQRHTYVDDILAGADTLPDALQTRAQVIEILRSAGMELDKWSANDAALLSTLDSVVTRDRQLSDDDDVSTLGLRWKPASDQFCFRVLLLAAETSATKRGLLSTVARLFDPVGWLAPVLIRAKILIQRLWIQGCDWDQELDDTLLAEWNTFHQQLPDIETIRIPRFFGTETQFRWFLHGFADASELAYAAALYLVTQENDQWRSTLIAAKSKVAPIRTVSLPRLELCGALLLSRLTAALLPQLKHPPAKVFCWLDSTVALAWIRQPASSWKTYVANRVSEIQTLVPQATWHHVDSQDNPADCASRGLSPTSLREFRLWWCGPDWLLGDWSTKDPSTPSCETDMEAKTARPVVFHVASNPESFEHQISKVSKLCRLINSCAYVLRWPALRRVARGSRPGRHLTANEVSGALLFIVRQVQKEHFSAELQSIQKGKALPKRSVLQHCLPFIDEQGVLRVGGRLHNSFLDFEEKHPMLVPLNSHLATLIIRDAHAHTLHGGPQLVLSYIRRRFWIPQARNQVRRIVRSCVRCTRFRGRAEEQQMAPLPDARSEASESFTVCGVDYAGPFPVRTTGGRGHHATKGYVCLFVCFSTRAVHLEVVSDMTTKKFLQAFDRFTDRRGCPKTVYSDNGTNFQGASTELRRMFLQASSFSQEVAAVLAGDGIEWKFIPPRAPHFGGLWEAGVKSFKHHLKRVLGDASLTFEEFSTLTSNIEACLNSRPISPLSNNPEDLTALTPGHFLIGRALKAVPRTPDAPVKLAGLPRYRLTEAMRNHFWGRWQKEVLHQYQQRTKWLHPNTTLHEGDLVLVTDINLPATKWPMARVLRLHHGSDGLARVATLQLASTTLDRPIVKLVRLPLDSNTEDGAFPDPPTAGGPADPTAGGPADSTAGGASNFAVIQPHINIDVASDQKED